MGRNQRSLCFSVGCLVPWMSAASEGTRKGILREIENRSTGEWVQHVFWLSGLAGISTIAQTSAKAMFVGGEFRSASPVLDTSQTPYDLPNTRLPARLSVSTFPRGAAPHPPTVCCSRSSSPPPPELGRPPHQHTSHD